MRKIRSQGKSFPPSNSSKDPKVFPVRVPTKNHRMSFQGFKHDLHKGEKKSQQNPTVRFQKGFSSLNSPLLKLSRSPL